MKEVSAFDNMSFSAKLGRLKESLGVAADQDAAEALGLTRTALSLRKRRDAFPVEALSKLCKERPELGIDVVYVLTGDRALQAAVNRHLEASARKRVGGLPISPFAERVFVARALMMARGEQLTGKERAQQYERLVQSLNRLDDRAFACVVELVRILAGEPPQNEEQVGQADATSESGVQSQPGTTPASSASSGKSRGKAASKSK